MKLFIASDIHGSSYYCQKLINAFENEKADRILLLGDILYHGPRNDLPKEYDPKKVIEMLNKYCDKILSVRGNCDSEVDQMVLNFPCLADYTLLFDEDKTIFITHGHIYNAENMPKIKAGDVLLHGHTHVTACEKLDCGAYYINPGSVSIPKNNTQRGYLIFEKSTFIFKNLDGDVLNSFSLL